MKKFFLVFTIIFNLSCFSQIKFEKGYYINNNNHKVNCFIKYKITEDSKVSIASIKNIKEFGDDINSFKYIRQKVDIDMSSDNLLRLSNKRNPIFEEKELFLKVLIEGKANLYLASYKNLKRFFYKKNTGKIEQLVYKRFFFTRDAKLNKDYDNSTSGTNVAKNNQFRQQLLTELKCDMISVSMLENLTYEKSDLVALFKKYNKCSNTDYVEYIKKNNKKLFNISVRPRFNNSTLSTKNVRDSSRDINNPSSSSFGLGLEAEFILPYNRNKWAVVIEPTYQEYKINNKSLVDGRNFNLST
jgi:hypothetical protein